MNSSLVVARESLLKYIATTWCWGSGAAKKAEITTECWTSFVCQFDTFWETRELVPRQLPYKGENYSRPEQGMAPTAWQMPGTVYNTLYADLTFEHEVPFSSVVRNCGTCNATGSITCNSCHGTGKTSCHRCNGSGRVSIGGDNPGDKACDSCGGDGKITDRREYYISVKLLSPIWCLTVCQLDRLTVCLSVCLL